MSSYTFTGPWINYDRNSVLGATLTLTESGGGFLTAFLGIFIVFVGGGFWTIFSFILFEIGATKKPVDGLHLQHQVILRNSQSPWASFWEFFMLPCAWVKRPADGPVGRHFQTPPKHFILNILFRCWSLSVWGLLVFIGWTAAGILSSEASKSAGTDTLIRSYNCGTWEIPSVSNVSIPHFGFKLLSDSISAASYAGLCYGSNTNDPRCKSFIKQQIPFSSRTDANCPFADGWCWYNDSAALELNTGFIDSHEDLGINAPPEDRVKYHRVATCSVIKRGRYGLTNTSAGPIYQYFYGPISGTSQWTFQYHEIESTFGGGYDLK
ncbi:uncharacterized protein N7458_002730 [Penicillium daleae]|uniref:Uncharacterized protein n=1 Tax=Penicillium daleae TaxID=63821 RepID=A0AAD6CF65_9EURO|nr:uncharacterized protein N7458_002730 [Penicillium daleae]KAJ5461178.1 hypothetical protein N7458_002730 [Penicillium daleae]